MLRVSLSRLPFAAHLSYCNLPFALAVDHQMLIDGACSVALREHLANWVNCDE